jgi:hypothetical protein
VDRETDLDEASDNRKTEAYCVANSAKHRILFAMCSEIAHAKPKPS